ncbi:relaxase/mobilization nuclease domain-containing protein [Algoriphagus sp. PAP.12]|uniref:relaxase/mobilization nuclease domain-containing protein n=1 Tax=Algoriphagus sp. PAP.12 TaxID=2996678 RepID=UPI00227D4532|nr:relaxase/mobilization nuclease domain-containing protein [Algoriphagus sp. PAP.12]
MIAKQSIGTSFLGALNYNLKKLYTKDPSQKAELLETNFVSLQQDQIKKELNILRDLNPRLKRNTYHTSLNFAIGEEISNQKMLEVAQEYMKKMGFDNNAYFIFRHHDSSHPHCHILSLRNRFDGTVVSDSNNYMRSEKIVRELEEKYGLEKVNDSEKANFKAPNKDELEMVVRTGKASNKMLMQEKVATQLHHSKTIQDLIRNLEKQGIYLLFNQANTGRVSGITYLSKDFKAKGQALGNQFKWSNVKKSINYEQTRDSEEIGKANHRTKSIFGENTGRKQLQNSLPISATGRINPELALLEQESKPSGAEDSKDPREQPNGFGTDQKRDSAPDQQPEENQDSSHHLLSDAANTLAGLGNLLGNLSPSGNLEKDRKKKKKIDEGLSR